MSIELLSVYSEGIEAGKEELTARLAELESRLRNAKDMRKNQKTRTVLPPLKQKPLGAVEMCWTGAAEAMKYGSEGNSLAVTRADLQAAKDARKLFKGFTEQQMAVALLVLMIDLGRRIENKTQQNG